MQQIGSMNEVHSSLDNTRGRKSSFLQVDKFLVASFPYTKNNFSMILSAQLVSSRHPLLFKRKLVLLGKWGSFPSRSWQMNRQDTAIVQTMINLLSLFFPWITLPAQLWKKEAWDIISTQEGSGWVSEELTLSNPEADAILHDSRDNWPIFLVLVNFKEQDGRRSTVQSQNISFPVDFGFFFHVEDQVPNTFWCLCLQTELVAKFKVLATNIFSFTILTRTVR